MECGAKKQKTKVQHKTANPIFGEVFEFKGDKQAELGLNITVMHKNMISSDVLLGKCEVGPKRYVITKEVVESVGLHRQSKDVEDGGTIDLKYLLMPA